VASVLPKLNPLKGFFAASADPCRGAGGGEGAEVPKLNVLVVGAGAAGVAVPDAGCDLPKKSGTDPVSACLTGSEAGLPNPNPEASFLGASTVPNRFAGGAAVEVLEPRLAKSDVAGGLPAGVVDAAGLDDIGKKPPAAETGAGTAALLDPKAGGDSGSALVGALARGEEDRGLCWLSLDNGLWRTGTPKDESGLAPSLPRRFPESELDVFSAAGAGVVEERSDDLLPGEAGALLRGVKLIPENEFNGILFCCSRSSISGRSSSFAEKCPEPGVFALEEPKLAAPACVRFVFSC
jgi:hypothetical protein